MNIDIDEPISISAKHYEDDPLAYAELVQQGIHLIQASSGKLWTDFNVHDPGVTILEQACFALTDLKHRASHSIGDYLSNEFDRLEKTQHGLHSPQDILSCSRVTQADLEHVMLDSLADVQSVQISYLASGLVDIVLVPLEHMPSHRYQPLIERATALFESHRMLGESLLGVSVLPTRACSLVVSVQVNKAMRPEEVVAQIYERCFSLLSAPVKQIGYGDFKDHKGQLEKPLDEIFDGPLLTRGLIDMKALPTSQTALSGEDFYSAITDIVGVDEALLFKLVPVEDAIVHGSDDALEATEGITTSADYAVRLDIPTREQLASVSVFSDVDEKRQGLGRIGYARGEVIERLRIAKRTQEQARHSQSDPKVLVPKPLVQHRSLKHFTSFQHHFPPAYGLGRYGLPSYASKTDIAKNVQFKGYLLLFDQFMANFAAGLDELEVLFSTDLDTGSSYSMNVLSGNDILGIDDIYPDEADIMLSQLIKEQDNYHDRKGRMLDYLLALHGESFHTSAYLQFPPLASYDEIHERLLRHKVRFLVHLPSLGSSKAGFDGAASNVARYVSLKLGLSDPAAPNGEWLQEQEQQIENELVTFDGYDFEELSCDALDNARFESNLSDEDAQALRKAMFAGICKPALLDSVEGRYGYIDIEGDQDLFVLGANNTGWFVGTLPEGIDRAAAASWYRGEIEERHEYIRVIEHICLRPVAANDSATGYNGNGVGRPQRTAEVEAVEQAENFYAYKITVAYPDWTRRFSEPGFLPILKECVRQACPAHIDIEYRAMPRDELDEVDMLLECLYADDPSADPTERNLGASRLRGILLGLDQQPQSAAVALSALDKSDAP